ncbi:MAG: hypothetical protein R6V11_07275 [Ectothiorhodospiraceae bacterium]
MMASAIRLLLILVLATAPVCLIAAEGNGIREVPVTQVPAANIVERVRSLVGGDIVVIPAQGKLLVRGSEADAEAVRDAVARLDTRPARLRLTLRSGSPRSLRRDGIRFRDDGVRIQGTRRRNESDTNQTVTGLSGQPMQVRVGEERARTLQRLILGGNRPGLAERKGYVTAQRGVFARPQLHGDSVTVELAATRQAFNDRGERSGGEVTTTVRGSLGEWLPVASSRQQRREDQTDITRHQTRSEDDGTEWWLRVERIER